MKLLLLATILFQAVIAHSQTDPFISNLNISNGALLDVHDLTGKKIPTGKEAHVEGSTMLNEHFEKGAVTLKSGQQFKDVLLNLSLINNHLYFRKDSTEIVFVIPIEQFILPVKNGGKEAAFVFKNGYPPIRDLTSETFFQVLSTGPKLHLLKYNYKTVNEHYTYGGPVATEYKLKSSLFIYNVANKQIVPINNNLKSVKKSLPDFEAMIEQFRQQNKVDFKKEEEISALVDSINSN